MGRTCRAAALSSVAFVALAAAASQAWAEAAPPAAPAGAAAVGEVVVTARRREEALQSVPAAVTALTSSAIERAGIRRVTDLTSVVPNLSMNSGYRQGVTFISLRGIPTSQGGEPPVTVLVDGVQVPGLDFVNQELSDIQSIQVLRGPQGAIYGRGAIAGAVIIETRKPSNDFEGSYDLLYGRGNTIRGAATVSGPIVKDRLFGRFTVTSRWSDGLMDDLYLHTPVDFGRELGFQGELLANIDDKTTLDLHAVHNHGLDGASYEYVVDSAHRLDFKNYGPTNNPLTSDTHTIDQYSAKLDRELPFGTFTSITQYAYSISDLRGDGDFSPARAALQYNAIRVKAVNEDVRIASPSDQAFTWLAGAFIQRRWNKNLTEVYPDPAGGGDPFAFFSHGDQHDISLAWAVYGQGAVQLPGDFELSAALRYDSDTRQSFDVDTPASYTKHTFTKFQPQVTLKKTFNEDLSAYVTASRGFRSGGFNAYQDTLTLGVPRLYPSETAANYEVGVKSQWLDRRLVVNASLFHTDYKNQQFFFISVTPVTRDIVTIRSTRIDGGELEFTYRPVAGLTLQGNLGVADGEIKDFDGTGRFKGNRSPNAYQYTGDLSMEYQRPVANDIDGYVRLEYQHRGNIKWNAENTYGTDPAGQLNGRVGIARDRNWNLSVFCNNITNKRFPVLFQADAAGVGNHGQLLNLPRFYGVELRGAF